MLIEPTRPGPGKPAINIVLSFFKLFKSAMVIIFVEVGVPDAVSSPEYAVDKEFIEEVMVLDGIPVQGIPDSDRKSVILASENMEQNSINNGEVSEHSDKKDEILPEHKLNSQSNFNRSAIEDSTKKYTTFIGGIAGGLLSACLSNQIPCAAILIPSSSGIPDPEGASLLIETFNNFITDDKLKIETTQLKEQGQKLKKQLEQIIKAEQEQRAAGGGGGSGQEDGNISSHRFMYG